MIYPHLRKSQKRNRGTQLIQVNPIETLWRKSRKIRISIYRNPWKRWRIGKDISRTGTRIENSKNIPSRILIPSGFQTTKPLRG